MLVPLCAASTWHSRRKLTAARFSRGLTQSDLAAHLGVTRATVANYENGRRKIPTETLIHIARLCGKPLGFKVEARSERSTTIMS